RRAEAQAAFGTEALSKRSRLSAVARQRHPIAAETRLARFHPLGTSDSTVPSRTGIRNAARRLLPRIEGSAQRTNQSPGRCTAKSPLLSLIETDPYGAAMRWLDRPR